MNHIYILVVAVVTLNLNTAIGDAPSVQGFESESLATRGRTFLNKKAPPIASDYGSKDCAEGASPIAVFRLIHAPAHANYLKDLEEQGYCVIPEVISRAETQVLYERVWHEFIEKAWPKCKMDDRSNWKEAFPKHNKVGIFAGPAGQTQVMWDVRQDVRIVDIFANVWNTRDLIVSMDGLSLMCPSDIREGSFEPWPHVDQNTGSYPTPHISGIPPAGFVSESLLTTQPFTIQGQFLFEDSLDGDAGFYCIPKSHLRFTEFAPEIEAITAKQTSAPEGWKARDAYLEAFFSRDGYSKKHVTALQGSVILWDSRTVHWNQHAEKPTSRVRMVGYICYVPKARLHDAGYALRKEAFETGVSTTHDPAYPALKPSKDGQCYPGYEEYLEDPGYTQPVIQLTELGKALLGL